MVNKGSASRSGKIMSVQTDISLKRPDQAGAGLNRGALARPVASHQGYDFPFIRRKFNIPKHLNVPVPDIDFIYLKIPVCHINAPPYQDKSR